MSNDPKHLAKETKELFKVQVQNLKNTSLNLVKKTWPLTLNTLSVSKITHKVSELRSNIKGEDHC